MRDTRPHLAAPEIVGWETTLRCNMRCSHCGSIAGDARSQELNTREAKNLIQQCADLGVPRMVLTGGETLLRRDWRQIVDAIIERDLEVGLLTNGWALTDRMVKDLASYRGTSLHVSVSLDGARETHDRIRGLPGSFDRAFNGALALRLSGIPAAVITTVNHANLSSLPELRSQLVETLRPYCWQIQVTTPFGRAAEDEAMQVSPVEYAKVHAFICETRRVAPGIDVAAGDCVGYLSSIEDHLRDTPWQGCQAGLRLIGIQSNGNVKGCLSIIDDHFIEGNVLEEGLEAIWNRKGGFAFTRQFRADQLQGSCKGCPVGDQCRGGCSASSIAVHGQAHHAPYCLRAVEASAKARPKARKARATRGAVRPRM